MTTHEQLERKIAELHENMFALQKEIESVESKLVKVKDAEEWPQIGDSNYYFAEDGSVWHGIWDNETRENLRLSIGNCFRTEQEAEFAVERLKVLAEMRKFATNKSPTMYGAKAMIVYNNNSDVIEICPVNSTIYTNLCFESPNAAHDCIDTIGVERLKKYYFGVKEDE